MAYLVALSDYWWGWAGLLFRWLHVIAAMAWIGASFYYIALDNHLQPPKDPEDCFLVPVIPNEPECHREGRKTD